MCLGVQQFENTRLRINSFYIRLSGLGTQKPVPDSLTLCFLPRINGSPVEINGSWILPDSTGFVTLHRVVSGGLVVFGSRERVRLSEGARFDVYVVQNKVLRGIFRKDEGNQWEMEVDCALESDIGITKAEVCVVAEGVKAMTEKVTMVPRRKNKYCFQKLEEIPEQREGDMVESDGCCCCSKINVEDGCESDSGEEVVDAEGVRWAVDVGIWVVSLGVGYLVSKAASKAIRPKIIL